MNFLKLLSQEIYASCVDQLFGNQKPVQNTGNLDVKNNRWLHRRDLTLWKTVDRCYGYGYYVKDGILMRDGLTGAMPINEPGIILPGTPAAFLACQDLEGVQLLNRPETPLLPEGYKGFSVPEDSPLREAQREAVRKANAPLSFIWGPPGTGKTFTIVKAVEAMLALEGSRVLITSTADKAVEAVVSGLLKLDLGSKLQFCKDEGESKVNRDNYRLFDYYRQEAAAKLPGSGGESAADLNVKADKVLAKARVVATNSLSAVAKLSYGKLNSVSHLIIDEASMMPMWMVSILAHLLHRLNPHLKIVLVGDPKQLPAVVKSEALEGHPLGMNVYEYMGVDDPQHCTPQSIITLLDSTSRMPNLLTRAISRAWYSDALVALRKGEYSPLFAGRPQVDFWSDNYPLFWPFSSRINMLGEADRPERCNRNYNVAEAAHATSLVLACKANNRTCLVIAPYNNQVNLINHWLDKNGVSDVRAVSVHKAQGQEADIVIWSVCFDPNKKMCRHNSPHSAVAQTLANVALSRAKQQVIVLGAYPGQPTVAGQFLSLMAPLIQEQAVSTTKVEMLPQQDESPPARKLSPDEEYRNELAASAVEEFFAEDNSVPLEAVGPQKPEYNGPTTVVNLNNKEDYDVYIGRAGQGLNGYFGNPIVRGKQCCVCGNTHHDNQSIVACYRKRFYRMIEEDEVFAERISYLKGKRLGCFCKPDHCHGDVIAEYLESPESTGSDLSFERKEVSEEPEKAPEVNLQANPPVVKPVKKTNPWGASEDLIEALLAELK